MIELTADNRKGQKTHINCMSIRYESQLRKPSTVGFSYSRNNGAEIVEGDIISLIVDDEKLFLGYVFSVSYDKDTVNVVAYDQIRFLMYMDSYIFEMKKASDIFKKICSDLNLKMGEVENTGVNIDLSCDNQKMIDIITQALDKTEAYSGGKFYVCDEYGKLCIRKLGAKRGNYVLSGNHSIFNFSVESSIEKTYTRVKLIKKGKKEGRRDVIVDNDKKATTNYGILQFYQNVDEKLSTPMIKQMAATLLKQISKPNKTISLSCIGETSMIAGVSATIEIEGIEDGIYIIQRAQHNFKGEHYDMRIEMMV